MRIPLDLPDPVWVALVELADAKNVKVNDLLRRAVLGLIPAEVPARERIPVLVQAGLPDAVIAERLRVGKAFVGDIRRAHGLKPNRFDRAAWDHEFKEARERAA
jgi:hypothetical protein